MACPLARTEGLVIQELPEETLVYREDNHQAHCLNKTAALVWRHCDGRTSVADLARQLSAELGVPVEECVVEAALEELRQADLLQAGAPAGRSYSRRELVAKMGIAMLLVPAVLSITAPKASAGGSEPDGDGDQDGGDGDGEDPNEPPDSEGGGMMENVSMTGMGEGGMSENIM